MVDWNTVISNLSNGKIVTVDPTRWNMNNPEYAEMLKLWTAANFNLSSIKWTNYYPGKHFDHLIESCLAEQLGITALRSWISCVEPGYMTGYHYDIDDNETEYLKHGEIKRYSVFISEPSVGQLFILDREYHYNKPQGSILQWNSYRDWHNGINGSLSNKFMFHLLGY